MRIKLNFARRRSSTSEKKFGHAALLGFLKGFIALLLVLNAIYFWAEHQYRLENEQIKASHASFTAPVRHVQNARLDPAKLTPAGTAAPSHAASPDDIKHGGAEETTEEAEAGAAGEEETAPASGPGSLPRIADDGSKPFETYKRPFNAHGAPYIALGLVDFGLDATNSETSSNIFPPQISVIISPYTNDLGKWVHKAKEQHREIWLSIPVETADFPNADPGPRGLLRRLSLQENRKRLYANLSRFQGYAGVVFNADETLLDTRAATQNIMNDLYARGLGYFDLKPDAPSFFELTAVSQNAPYLRNDFTIGETLDIKAQLDGLAAQAKKTGHAVASLSVTPASLGVIQQWLADLKKQGIVVAPLSAAATYVTAEHKE